MGILHPRHMAGAFAVLALMGSSALARTNPLLQPSTLPYEAPRFDLITDADFAPAFEQGMQAHNDEIHAITANPDRPDFVNTIEALERAGRTLHRVDMTFDNLYSANSNPRLDAIKTKFAPLLTQHEDEIYLNTALFNRVATVYQKRNSLDLTQEQMHVLTEWYHLFLHAGASLSSREKTRLKDLNSKLSVLESSFQQKLVAATKAAGLIVDVEKKLSGLDANALNTAYGAAEAAGQKGRWLVPLQNTTQQFSLAVLKDRETRQALFQKSWTRAEQGDGNDTRALIVRIAHLRAEKARLLGFRNYAAYQLENQMARTPEAANDFMNQLVAPTRAAQDEEEQALTQLIQAEGSTFSLAPWDWDFYADKLRRKTLGYSEDDLKPYFELKTVLEDGVFYAATSLYGITFNQRHDIPVYQSDVVVYEVRDKDDAPLGLMYFDYFARDNKFGGAWMSNFVEQSKLLKQKPVIYNVGNFVKAAPGQPQLITFDDVITMFHEFGHALHGLFADQVYPSVSGTNVARDFVEFPSQFNENWALYPKVFAHYARHYQTGATMPEALQKKLFDARHFNAGYRLGEVVSAAMLDMKWHTMSPNRKIKDVDRFESNTLEKSGLDTAHVPPRYRSSYFLHIWGNGYQAGYYAYLWTQMLDHDAFDWFRKHGGLTRANGQRFRDLVLSRGHTEDYDAMFEAFTGHTPDIKPMLDFHGLKAD